ncbi:MAG: 1-acyl-sn-glycerol-3-phosphate acyltransferase [Oscillospiraceae bacterium]|nr:1-acyl-sn-glycerol-3-phosphate acyltransferase [Oscillospiraceae bacterium]
MKQKATLDEKLCSRQLELPNGLLYRILMVVVKLLNMKTKTNFTYNARPAEEEGPIVLIANHASRVDFQFTAPVCFPKKLNYVVGYNEFFRFPTCILLKLMQVIPKKNFTPDTYTVRQILRVVKKGGSICIMPEGMSSITGMAQPVIPGGAKLLKKLGLPVYYSKISGGYLTYTKHCLDERVGRIDVSVNRMFTPQQLRELSLEEIEDTMNRLLAHDDYIWNKQQQVTFKGKGQMAKQLDTLLYMCPRCGKMYDMECSGNTMRCRACGNTVELDERYNLRPVGDSVCPELVTDWTIAERKKAAEDVRREGFFHEGHVRIGVLPDYKNLTGDSTSVICGDGMLRLDGDGLHFEGSLRGEPFSFRLSTEQVPTFGMCTDISRFYTFVEGRFIEFYPDDGDVLRWDHLTEEMHRYRGGKWQNTEYRHTEP